MSAGEDGRLPGSSAIFFLVLQKKKLQRGLGGGVSGYKGGRGGVSQKIFRVSLELSAGEDGRLPGSSAIFFGSCKKNAMGSGGGVGLQDWVAKNFSRQSSNVCRRVRTSARRLRHFGEWPSPAFLPFPVWRLGKNLRLSVSGLAAG